MKLFTALAALTLASTALVGCAVDESPSAGWAARGDQLVKVGNYKQAYAAYMSRCEDTTLPMDERLVGCGAARDLRTTAKSHGVSTTGW
jgi:hypothetical protein